ncbi:MAG: hypothetical protein AAF519_16640 [Bacteroidota bacterium]
MTKNQIFKIVRIIIYSGYLLALSLVFLYDARSTTGKFYENSLTEYFQEGTFFLTVMAYLFCTFNFKQTAAISVLIGGFFLMAFIREFDAVLDAYVYDGAWQTLVLIVIAMVGYRSYRSWKSIKRMLPDYMSSYPFGLMIGGMLVTFIYSRLFGEAIMWKTVMEENYVRDVKNAVEESVELLGDSIIFFAGLEFIFWAKKQDT